MVPKLKTSNFMLFLFLKIHKSQKAKFKFYRVIGINMETSVKFLNYRLSTVKILALRKKFDIPTDDHTDIKPSYTISFASEAKNMDGSTYRCPHYSLSMLVPPIPIRQPQHHGVWHTFIFQSKVEISQNFTSKMPVTKQRSPLCLCTQVKHTAIKWQPCL